MKTYKEMVAERFVGKRVRFKSGCTVPLDITGEIVSYRMMGSEIIYNVLVKNANGTTRTVPVGENMSRLQCQILS